MNDYHTDSREHTVNLRTPWGRGKWWRQMHSPEILPMRDWRMLRASGTAHEGLEILPMRDWRMLRAIDLSMRKHQVLKVPAQVCPLNKSRHLGTVNYLFSLTYFLWLLFHPPSKGYGTDMQQPPLNTYPVMGRNTPRHLEVRVECWVLKADADLTLTFVDWPYKLTVAGAWIPN